MWGIDSPPGEGCRVSDRVVMVTLGETSCGQLSKGLGPASARAIGFARWNEHPCRTLVGLTLTGDAPAHVALGVFPGGVPQLAALNLVVMSVEYARYGN